MKKKQLIVMPIKNGTVIDHIKSGQALNVLRILGISGKTKNIVSVAMNVPSKFLGLKDIVKVEDRELKEREVDKIALISPAATINIIREYEVVEKYPVHLPKKIENVVKCTNHNCISNTDEPIKSIFIVSNNPIELRCFYCDDIISGDIAKHLI